MVRARAWYDASEGWELSGSGGFEYRTQMKNLQLDESRVYILALYRTVL